MHNTYTANDGISYNAFIQSLFIRVQFTNLPDLNAVIFFLSLLNQKEVQNMDYSFGKKKLCLTADLDI